MSKKKTADGGTFSNISPSDDEKQLTFEVHEMDVGILNAVRRAAIAHVPSVAFDYHPTVEDFPACGVKVYKNTSTMHNEMLGARLALVPVCVTENELEKLRSDAAKEDARNPLMFELKEQNNGTDTQLVTTADLRLITAETGDEEKRGGGKDNEEGKKGKKEEGKDGGFDAEKLFPPCRVTGDHILITKLKPNPYGNNGVPGDEVHVRCAARVGTGQEHARWSPVSVCYFTNKIDPDAADAAFQRWVGEQQARKDAHADDPKRLRARFDALEAKRHFFRDPLTGEANRFEFRVESECGLRAASIVFLAFEALLQRVKAVRLAIETRDIEKVSTFVATSAGSLNSRQLGGKNASHTSMQQVQRGLHHLVIKGEGHTLGNLIQTVLFARNFTPDGKPKPSSGWPVVSVGYEQPHPLEDCIVMRVKMSDPAASIEAFMIDNLSHVEDTLRGYAREWVKASGLDELNIRFIDRFMA